METSQVVHTLFSLVFTGKICSPQSHVLLTSRKVWRKKDLPCLEEDSIREHLRILDIHNSIGPNETYTQMPKGHGCYHCRITSNHLLNIFCINTRLWQERCQRQTLSDRTRTKNTEVWDIRLGLQEILFYCENVLTLKQGSQRGCGLPILKDIRKLVMVLSNLVWLTPSVSTTL